MRKISKFLKSEINKLNLSTPIPIIIFAKGAHYAIEDLANSDYDVVSLDWTIKPAFAKRLVGNKVSIQVCIINYLNKYYPRIG